MSEWIGEKNYRLGFSILLKLKPSEKPIIKPANFFKSIIIGNTEPLGKVLVFEENGGTTLQITEKWDFYSEMLVHVAMCSHPNPRRVLIIGGGDGGTAREVLKHKEVREVTIVEIDEKVVEACKEFLKIDKGALSHEKTRIVIKDGLEYLGEYEGEPYDIILGDWTDPYLNTPAEKLITERFFNAAKKALQKDGILAVQSGSPIFQPEVVKRAYRAVKKVFNNVYLYLAPIPFYPGGLWSFIVASDKIDPRTPLREIKETVYYTREIHLSSFALPYFIKKMLEEQ
ncbi:MAG: polyamine aminopropyltransferase [Candidatus Njordarchaeales archaeon]